MRSSDWLYEILEGNGAFVAVKGIGGVHISYQYLRSHTRQSCVSRDLRPGCGLSPGPTHYPSLGHSVTWSSNRSPICRSVTMW